MKERKLFEIQSRITDRDFSEVFRIYMATERGSEKRLALIACIGFSIFFAILTVVLRNWILGIFAGASLMIGLSYFIVPINKKFIAENKLLFGTWRETVFYAHSVTVMELFQEDDALNMSDEELREAVTEMPTTSMIAYESEIGFLFADGKIAHRFVYIPKRDLSEAQLSALLEFAADRCSGGYQRVRFSNEPDAHSADSPEHLVEDACEQYYGADKLNLQEDDTEQPMPEPVPAPAPKKQAPEPEKHIYTAKKAPSLAGTELDVDAELARILAETEDEDDGE